MSAPSKERKTATITVRGLDIGVKEEIQKAAQLHGRSMESEVRGILEAAASQALRPLEPASDPLKQLRLSDEALSQLEVRARRNSRSVADEARAVLEHGTRPVDAARILYSLSRESGGFDELVIPERTAAREIPDFS